MVPKISTILLIGSLAKSNHPNYLSVSIYVVILKTIVLKLKTLRLSIQILMTPTLFKFVSERCHAQFSVVNRFRSVLGIDSLLMECTRFTVRFSVPGYQELKVREKPNVKSETFGNPKAESAIFLMYTYLHVHMHTMVFIDGICNLTVLREEQIKV